MEQLTCPWGIPTDNEGYIPHRTRLCRYTLVFREHRVPDDGTRGDDRPVTGLLTQATGSLHQFPRSPRVHQRVTIRCLAYVPNGKGKIAEHDVIMVRRRVEENPVGLRGDPCLYAGNESFLCGNTNLSPIFAASLQYEPSEAI